MLNALVVLLSTLDVDVSPFARFLHARFAASPAEIAAAERKLQPAQLASIAGIQAEAVCILLGPDAVGLDDAQHVFVYNAVVHGGSAGGS